ncbi:MAG: hypothetical protein ACRDLM_05970 [Gaiellaceae bacterium]
MVAALDEGGAVVFDLGAFPVEVRAAAFKFSDVLVALSAPITGRVLVSQRRLFMARRRLEVATHAIIG